MIFATLSTAVLEGGPFLGVRARQDYAPRLRINVLMDNCLIFDHVTNVYGPLDLLTGT